MSSLNDTKSNYWQKDINNRSAAVFSDTGEVGPLLASPEIDYLNMPEITTKPKAFNNFEQLVDIKINDEFHDSNAFITPIGESSPAIISEPVPITEKTTLADESTPLDKEPSFTSAHEADENVKPIADALETDQATKSISINLLNLHAASRTTLDKPSYSASNSNVAPVQAKEAQSKLPFSEGAVMAANTSALPEENIPSLVDNYTNVENIASSNDFLLAGLGNHAEIASVENKAHQPSRMDSDKRMQASLTITSTISEGVYDSEWALYKLEQDKIQTQMQKRITQLEKSLRTATLFSLIAALLSGVALIAAVSGLV
jgi:hypothetical protein